MTTARYMVGDVYDRLAEIEAGSVDVAITSPPFLALRSYLPDSHPDKAREIGSEGTPAAFIDALLGWTAAVGRVLAPHGSIAVELGDTYSGSGGAGGDYDEGGLRDGQSRFDGAAARARAHPQKERTRNPGPGWPLAKSLAGIPQAYQLSLAYGRNVLTGAASPAGRWIVRNVKPWIRSNPPVGELGDKERPATSFVIVATRARDRYFDLDAVRTQAIHTDDGPHARTASTGHTDGARRVHRAPNVAGAPPRDWWHHVDAVLDAELDRHTTGAPPPRGRNGTNKSEQADTAGARAWRTESGAGARGVHLRRALERAGILRTVDALDVSPKGYSGAHYAVWPPELVRLLLAEMCPTRVCTTCGHPSRRLIEQTSPRVVGKTGKNGAAVRIGVGGVFGAGGGNVTPATYVSAGWSDCGHGTWRPGRVLDPFAGSGTTLAVASGMGFDSVGIDIDYRNAGLAMERVGMFLDVWWPDHNGLPALGAGRPSGRYEEWLHLRDDVARHVLDLLVELLHGARSDNPTPDFTPRPRARTVRVLDGQTDLFAPTPEETPTP